MVEGGTRVVEGDAGSCIYKGHVYIHTAYLRRSSHLLDDEHDGVVPVREVVVRVRTFENDVRVM